MLSSVPGTDFGKPGLFVNLTNHPISGWKEEQLEAARKYGDIMDLDFPAIGAKDSKDDVRVLADKITAQIIGLDADFKVTLHIMGEMTFTFAVVSRLKEHGITCLASTTERDGITMLPDGKKISTFKFVQFREY